MEWELVQSAAEHPRDLPQTGWRPAQVPGTVAGALGWDHQKPRDLDAKEWWYRTRFRGGGALRFGGLATIAEVFLDGERVLSSANMFVAHELAVVDGEHELYLRFKSLAAALGARRPRPRWKTKLVSHQNLRWFRTTLLGRMPGWSPPVAPVGPWRDVTLGAWRPKVRLATSLDGTVTAIGEGLEGLELTVGDARVRLGPHGGALRVPDAERWWPHTHGPQPRYAARLGDVAIGHVAFRTVEQVGDFALAVNGVPIFCRGACWTPSDVVTLRPPTRDEMLLARRGGVNMLRVGGTFVYEDDAFYELCDELGILVWQDFMLANMDYPAEVEPEIALEARQLLERLQGRPSLAVLCGSSELEQQAAMLGLPRDAWRSRVLGEILPDLARELAPGIPYVPSSPTGGTLPFQVDTGVAHYYGVGAYLRPLEDARRANVRFAAECLAFANVPEPDTVALVLPDGEPPAHHPKWKERVPRDFGPGWDFEDVRDFYLKLLFGVDPLAVRYADPWRYLALARVTSGEVMASALGEWRRAASTCKGALIWFWRDLWPGAGWGVVDSLGIPKAAYWFMKRALAPVALLISDEGMSGLRVHAVNDTPEPVDGELGVRLLRSSTSQVVARGERRIVIPPRGQVEVNVDELFDGFLDVSYAYRFGPPGHDLVVATLIDASGLRGEAFHLPLGRPAEREPDVGLTALIEGDELRLMALRFAYAVAIEGLDVEDNYLHLEPGRTRAVKILGAGRRGGHAQPLNAHAATRILPP